MEKVYLSPLKRCVETAHIILEDRNIEKIIVNELMEINMGEWEGKTFSFIKSSLPEQFKNRGEDIGGFVPTGGESFKNLEKRVIPAFESIINSTSGNIIIISHAGVNRVILKNILSISMQDIFKINQPYGCINELSFSNGKWNWKLLL
nr:histidine phosphatase family protein [Clostridium ljungdahlii]